MRSAARLGAAALLAAAMGTARAARAASDPVAFADDFRSNIAPDDGLGAGWTVSGLWYVNGGQAVSDLDEPNLAAIVGHDCADCRIEASVVGFGVPETAVFLRGSAGDRYDLVLLGSGRLQIRRFRGGAPTVLGEASSGIRDLGSPATLSLVATGAGPVQLAAQVNGVERLRIVDASAQGIGSSGAAGLGTGSAGVWFAAVRLYAQSGGTGGDGGVPGDGGTATDGGTVTDGGTATDGGTRAGGLPFSDDFARQIAPDDGLGTSWSVSGLWYSNGSAVSDLDGTNQALETKALCADCVVEAQVVGYGSAETAISLRAADPADRYDLVLLGDGNLRIRRVRGGAATTLAEGPSGVRDLTNPATLALQAAGSAPVTLIASVNGTTVLSAKDASSAALTGPGEAGLWTLNAGVQFGAFRLTGTAAGAGTDGGTVGGPDDWTFFRHDLAGTGAGVASLTAAQAQHLHLAWQVDWPVGIDANPIVAAGTLYLAVADGTLLALDARTGATRWSARIGTSRTTSCVPYAAGPVGAPAVVGQRVFASGGDGFVYAFDKDSGALLWSTKVANTLKNDFLWSSIFPLQGRIYLGVATLYEPICGPVPGRFVSLDQATGAQLAEWWADPAHGPGGGVWTQPAYDARTNRIFLTTGTVADKVDPRTRPLQQAFVAVDPVTLQTLDSFQPVPNVYGDEFDFGASPSLVDTAGGRHLIMAANKNGYVYALDRDHLAHGVLWTSQISGPGASPDIGESTIVSAAYGGGSLYVAGGKTTDGYPGAIAALDPLTGAVRWKMHPDGFVLPALTAAGDVLVAGVSHAADKTGRLYVLEQATGAVLFSRAMPGAIFAEPTFAEGMLYVVDENGTIRAYAP
jgi:outer membrane protein assembly factor BamB